MRLALESTSSTRMPGIPRGLCGIGGRLLYVEYAADDIKAWDGKQAKIYWRKDHCGANPLIRFRDDHILVACYDGNYLVELDADGKEVGTISKDSSGELRWCRFDVLFAGNLARLLVRPHDLPLP